MGCGVGCGVVCKCVREVWGVGVWCVWGDGWGEWCMTCC